MANELMRETAPSNGLINIILAEEREQIARGIDPPVYATGKMATAVLSDGMTWHQFAMARLRETEQIDVLLVGAGDDAAAVTGGIDRDVYEQTGQIRAANRQNPELADLAQWGRCRITAQTKYPVFERFVYQHGVAAFYPGHFFDALRSIKHSGQRFDLIESNWSLFTSKLAPVLVEMVDDLLTDDGAAFLTGVHSTSGVGGFLIYPPEMPLPESLNQAIVWQAQSMNEAQFGGIPWNWNTKTANDIEEGAWRKGEFNRMKPLQLRTVLPIDSNLHAIPPIQVIYSPLLFNDTSSHPKLD